MPDEITLTIPRKPEFRAVASYVLGGLAARLDLTIESLEDIQLALDALLQRAEGAGGDVTVRLVVRDEVLVTRVGPLEPRVLDELERDAGDELGVRRVLDSTVDDVLVDGEWAVLDQGDERFEMSADSDKVLLRRYHEDGDLQAREALIEKYMSLVRSLARRYSYRGEQLDDLIQIGAIGLIKAIDRFDVNRGVELTTYATPNIIGEIKRHFRDKGWSVRVPRGLQELNVQLSKLVEQLTVELGRSPTIPELAESAGVDEEDVLEALESGRAYTALSLLRARRPRVGRSSTRSRPWLDRAPVRSLR